jgi:hypothetical protein
LASSLADAALGLTVAHHCTQYPFADPILRTIRSALEQAGAQVEDVVRKQVSEQQAGHTTAQHQTAGSKGKRHPIPPPQGQNPRVGLRFCLRRRGTGGLTSSIRCARDTRTMPSTKRRWTICAGAPWLKHVIHQLAVHQLARYADRATRQTRLERLDIMTSQVTLDPICIASEGVLWGSIQAHGKQREIVIVGDGAGQFAVGRPALCSVHAERLLHKLDTFTNLHRAERRHGRAPIWRLYDYLKNYRTDPTARLRGELCACIYHIFCLRTDFVALDRLLVRLHANKPALLMVLDRPEIPLHTNGSERDIRLHVTKRKISGGTRSVDGRDCRDAFLGLMRTAAKLGIAFWDYLGDRLAIPGQPIVPYLPDLLRCRAHPA